MVRRASVTSSSQKISSKITRWPLINLLLFGGLVYAVLSGLGGARQSLTVITDANPWYVVLAVLTVVSTYPAAAVTYCLISAHRLRFLPTVLVQIASSFVNRLLPSGLGGLGINIVYLKNQGHTPATAAAVVATNNLLGFLATAVLLAVLTTGFRHNIPALTMPQLPTKLVIGILGATVFGVGAVAWLMRATWGRRLRHVLTEVLCYGFVMARRPHRLVGGLTSSMILTMAYSSALYFVALAVGAQLSWPAALLVLSLGSALGAALPTPGGLGGTEAGLLTGLSAYGIPLDAAVATVVLYRALTYWLPLVPGYVTFRLVLRRYL